MLTTLMSALEIKFVFKIEINAWGLNRFFHYKTNSEALTVLILFCCKALRKRLEHLRSEEKHSTASRVSPHTSLVL